MNEYRFTFVVEGAVGMNADTRDQARALVEQSLRALHPGATVEVLPVVDDTRDITELDQEVTADA